MTDNLPPRNLPVQGPPPADVSSLPGIAHGRPQWFREHGDWGGPDRGCWYFATLPSDPSLPSGRFDLPADDGTCYFGSNRHVAAMERVGRFTAKHVPVPADFVAGRVVTTIDGALLPSHAANMKSSRGGLLGITGELFTMSDYSIPQAWALALAALGHDALLYPPRFTPGGEALAVFGDSGAQPAPIVESVPLADVLDEMSVKVASVPGYGELEIVDPTAK